MQMREPMHVQVHKHGDGDAGRAGPPLAHTASGGPMSRVYNGISAHQLQNVTWRKSGRSNSTGNCVELAELASKGDVAVRNSRDPEGPALVYTRDEIEALILGIKDGDFDDLMR
jgi:hypothetical protein